MPSKAWSMQGREEKVLPREKEDVSNPEVVLAEVELGYNEWQ